MHWSRRMVHNHRYIESEHRREWNHMFMKFVFECIDCGAIKTEIINPNKEFKVEIQ